MSFQKLLKLCLQVRIWARRKAIEDKQGDYALNVTGPILQFYEQYYNAPYPLSKSGGSTLNQHQTNICLWRLKYLSYFLFVSHLSNQSLQLDRELFCLFRSNFAHFFFFLLLSICCQRCWRRSQMVKVYHLGTMGSCIIFQNNPSNNCRDVSLDQRNRQTEQPTDLQTNIAIPGIMCQVKLKCKKQKTP